ncbi:MAG: hypothetical protein BGO69_08045 [Bacteroidetes bacterium 46-16]|nr:MAG: hypothetical protein BGO69_08045 [Bacteroidetes bacterium 46-16]
MKGTFSIDELQFSQDDSIAEQLRSRKVFETLKKRAEKGLSLTEHEKNFFCEGVEISHIQSDGRWEDYPCCDNPRFKFTYLIYFNDITGGGKYYSIKGTQEYRVPPEESRIAIAYLEEKAKEWDVIVQKTNHTEKLLQESCTEARSDLKALDKLPQFVNDQFSKGSFRYKYKRWGILLRARYIYLKALEIFEALTPDDLTLKLNNEKIEIDEYSIIHVTSRHFAGITQQTEADKSYHVHTFLPWQLGPQLKPIFEQIDKTGLFKDQSLDKIAIQFKGTDYLIWTKEREKFEKGKGKSIARRLETFYPVEDAVELKKLKSDSTLYKLNDETSFYYTPTNSN